jgi:hypothetical protein
MNCNSIMARGSVRRITGIRLYLDWSYSKLGGAGITNQSAAIVRGGHARSSAISRDARGLTQPFA